MLVSTKNLESNRDPAVGDRRLSLQPLLPLQIDNQNGESKSYQMFPYHSIGSGKIFHGFDSLAEWMLEHKAVIIDGYIGVLWNDVKQQLAQIFEHRGVSVQWISSDEFLKSRAQIDELVKPFLGSEGALWGKKFNKNLAAFFDIDRFSAIQPEGGYNITIVYGVGAALVGWDEAPIVYLDIPKNEIQYRMRAGSITNLGIDEGFATSQMYKRFYFVDWVALNNHKENLLPKLSIVADAQWLDTLTWMKAGDLHSALKNLSQSVFRVRPWFEAGAWGGQWMKERIDGINKKEVNLAWSFELIVPENGLVFESDGYLLELSFDFLMFASSKAVLGKHADYFENEFPIRFDFLDTWDGGNLSIQSHPSLAYIRDNFGERITQDETYYILDCKDEAKVYLGFVDNINPKEFRDVLEGSQQNNTVVAIEDYVQVHDAHKHDLFLIPNGTIHSAGSNNLVLEISATPYIFTFKMYDWLRLDLNGEPRAINIEHGFKNLNFDRRGDRVVEELISVPAIIGSGSDWKVLHLPTHAEHLYDIHRVEFDSKVTIPTNGSCHVLMLVEGTSVCVQTSSANESFFHYAETFVIPAAAEEYTVINKGTGTAKLVKAFIKDNIDFLK